MRAAAPNPISRAKFRYCCTSPFSSKNLMNLLEACERFLTHCETEKNLSTLTIRAYRGDLACFVASNSATRPVAEFSESWIEAAVQHWASDPAIKVAITACQETATCHPPATCHTACSPQHHPTLPDSATSAARPQNPALAPPKYRIIRSFLPFT
jgi:hypothetical protein